jgi:hypothetical protein
MELAFSFLFIRFFLVLVRTVVLSRPDSVIGPWLLSSACKSTNNWILLLLLLLLLLLSVAVVVVLENYHLFLERKFARPNDQGSYAGGSVSSW